MSYRMTADESSVLGVGAYANDKGHTECVVFVQGVTSAPSTGLWKKGIQVKGSVPGAILRGTAIATFDDNGKYPTDALGKHAAIYLSQNAVGIQVLDQWNAQGKVLPRTIRFGVEGKRSNNGDTFYVIE